MDYNDENQLKKDYERFKAQGMSDDDAFTEAYSRDCLKDEGGDDNRHMVEYAAETELAVVCVECVHHRLFVADSKGRATDELADECWDDAPTYCVIDERGGGERLGEFGRDYEGAKKFCEDYNKEHYGE